MDELAETAGKGWILRGWISLGWGEVNNFGRFDCSFRSLHSLQSECPVVAWLAYPSDTLIIITKLGVIIVEKRQNNDFGVLTFDSVLLKSSKPKVHYAVAWACVD